jgi:prevent-host-death family protein
VATPTSLPVHDFRNNLSDIVERAAFKSERFVVTSHGRNRAALVSMEDLAKLQQIEAKPRPAKRRRPQ